MKLTIYIDVQALRYTGKSMKYSILNELDKNLPLKFPDWSMSFLFVARKNDLVIGEEGEPHFWQDHQGSIKVAENLYANPELVFEYEEWLANLGSAYGPVLVVSPDLKLLDLIKTKRQVMGLAVTAFGKIFNFSGKPDFSAVSEASQQAVTWAYMDTDDSSLDWDATVVQQKVQLNKSLIRKIGSLSKTNTKFQQITSRVHPSRSLQYSRGEHEALEQINESDLFIVQKRGANALRMEGILAAVRSDLETMGFPSDAYNQKAIYTSSTCCKLAAIYWDLMQKKAELPKQIILFDDDFAQLNLMRAEIAKACQKIEMLGIELHLFWVRSAGVYASRDFSRLCRLLLAIEHSAEPAPFDSVSLFSGGGGLLAAGPVEKPDTSASP